VPLARGEGGSQARGATQYCTVHSTSSIVLSTISTVQFLQLYLLLVLCVAEGAGSGGTPWAFTVGLVLASASVLSVVPCVAFLNLEVWVPFQVPAERGRGDPYPGGGGRGEGGAEGAA